MDDGLTADFGGAGETGVSLYEAPITGGVGTVSVPTGGGGGGAPSPSGWESFVQSFGAGVGSGVNRVVTAYTNRQVDRIYKQQAQPAPKNGVGPREYFIQQIHQPQTLVIAGVVAFLFIFIMMRRG